MNKIDELYGDKGYNSWTIYNELQSKAVIPVKKNASTLSMSSLCRDKITRFVKRFNKILRKMKNNYGIRRNVEIYFFSVMRRFSEIIRAVKTENIVQEMMVKIYFYHKYNKLRKGY